jgi:hypothetical protein
MLLKGLTRKRLEFNLQKILHEGRLRKLQNAHEFTAAETTAAAITT